MTKLIAIFIASALVLSAALPAIDEIDSAIRRNDLDKLRHLIYSPETARASNGLHATPLHYAASYGSPDAVKLLLEAGADPNAKNQSGATPLVYAAWSFERTRLLVEHGASINVATNDGITPLMVAAAAHGNLETLRYLLNKGADVKAVTPMGEDALMRATSYGDVDMVQLLLNRGADAKKTDKAGFTALLGATLVPDSQRVRMLLTAGSDPNAFNTFGGMVKNGPIALVHLTPLMTAAPYSDQETISLLIKAGARVNETDSRKMTPLMLSIATDHAQPATVRLLIDAGADIQAKDIYGDTALDWARKYQNPEIISMLVAAGAHGRELSTQPVPTLRAETGDLSNSISRSMAMFGKSDFFRAGGGCAGCHHQPIYARAYAAARSSNLSADPRLRSAFLDSQVATQARLANTLPVLSSFGGDFDTLLAPMAANADLAELPSDFTDMMVHFIAARQDASGAWISGGIARAPLEESAITRTAYAIEALTRYSWPARKEEFDRRVQLAQKWLRQAKPETTYEHSDRILGLYSAGVPVSELHADAERLLNLQRENGGWAQTRYLEPDAYATGMVLDTLFKAGLVKETDAAYQRGVAFLLRTQYPDGSWYVRSRAPKFQPYFQSGFPFDHDQWISSTGTAWAVMALSHAAGASISAMR